MERTTIIRTPILLCVICLALTCGVCVAQQNGEWPCFHGSSRDNKSAETGLLKIWSENGPKLLWTVSGLGKGYSTVSIAEGHIYTSGVVDENTVVFAFDMGGKLVWKKKNGGSWATTMSHARTYNGARATPTYDDGLIYHLGDVGRLAVYNYRTGKEVWALELRETFDAAIPEYG